MRLGPKKIFLLIRWSQSTHRSLSLKGLVKKVYRAFITDTNQIRPFSLSPPYCPNGTYSVLIKLHVAVISPTCTRLWYSVIREGYAHTVISLRLNISLSLSLRASGEHRIHKLSRIKQKMKNEACCVQPCRLIILFIATHPVCFAFSSRSPAHAPVRVGPRRHMSRLSMSTARSQRASHRCRHHSRAACHQRRVAPPARRCK